ncbi:Lactate-binding periplasmic protein [subsurface metagenome]
MSFTYGGYWKGFMPEAGIEAGLPMLYRNSHEMNWLFYELGWLEIIREAYAEHGVYYLCPGSYAQVPIWATKPLRTLSDFEGVKIRAVGDMAEMLTDMGAACSFIPHEESYMALQLGTVEAYSTGLSVWESAKHYEVCPYVMWPGVVPVGIESYSISHKSLDKLPEDLDALIKGLGPTLNWKYTYWAESSEAQILAKIADYGGELVYYDDEVIAVFTQAGLDFLDGYVEKNVRCAKMAEILKGLMKERGYLN